MILKQVEGHEIAIGDDLDGPGVRIQIDGDDVTDDVLSVIGPPKLDNLDPDKGMPIPRGKQYTFSIVSDLVRSGHFERNK